MNVFVDSRFDATYQQDPLTLVDVGARGGLKPNWSHAQRHLRIIGLEPDQTEYQRLVEHANRDPNAPTFLGAAAHNRRGPVRLYVARDRGLSSVFPPDRDFLNAFPEAERFDTVDQREVEAQALDELLDAHQLTGVDFIKADTQGSELFVLQGAVRALNSSVIGVEVEAEFTPIYAGQPVFADVDAYLRPLGFQLFDLRPCYWKRRAGRTLGGPRGQIIWADALYLKSIVALRALVDGTPESRRPGKLLKAIAIALLYGYYDYAFEIAQELGGCLPAADRAHLIESLRTAGEREARVPRFPGRRPLASVLHRIWRRIRERNEGWSISDAEIGNLR